MAASLWTDDFLNQMRQETDPPADRAVATVFESGDRQAVNGIMTNLYRNDQPVPGDLPEPIRHYLEETSSLPDWANDEQLREAQQLFNIWGLSSCVILSCASLPECYVMKNGVNVLAMTQRIELHVRRRILETAQMIMDVMSPGGLSPGGRGIAAAQRVRLMHASIRWLILHPQAHTGPEPEGESAVTKLFEADGWDPAYGKPICQEDLAFTLQTFAHVALRSFDRLSIDLTDAQKDSYIACWNVTGAVMGIRQELLPADHKEAEQLFAIIKRRQAGENAAARAMAAALIQFQQNVLPGPLKDLPIVMTRHLIGDETAALLGVEEADDRRRKLAMEALELWRKVDSRLSKEYGHHEVLRFASEIINNMMLREMGQIPRGWKKQLFAIPSQLEANLPKEWDGDLFSLPKHIGEDLLGKIKAFGDRLHEK